MADDSGRISVSRDALRAELLQMELRLIEKLATQDEVDVIRKDVDSLKRWRAYLAGAAATAVALSASCAALIVWAFGNAH